tara:strand:- start:5991 stop:6479 length:489 start_codon:yes stop_codon:yes gene_type:complete
MRKIFKFNVNNFSIMYLLGFFYLTLPYALAEKKDTIKFLNDSADQVNKQQFENILLPMPSGDYNSSSLKVLKGRNPFNEITSSDSEDIDNVYESIKFKGVAKSKNIEYAIIESNQIQKFYRSGDVLHNGFLIKSISIKNATVDISNGLKNYRLSLIGFSKQK